MNTLTKAFSRQKYPLFFCYVWSESDLQRMQKWLGNTIQHLVMLRDGEKRKVTVWYKTDEIGVMHQALIKSINEDEQWFEHVKTSFYEYWNKLLPYINEEKELATIEDLKTYYQLWIDWWSPMAILFEIPNVDSLPLDIREKALKAREETQDFSDGGEETIETFFTQHYPRLSEFWRLMTPDEMFRSDNLSDGEIAAIQRRERDWVLVNGKLLTYAEMSSELERLGVELEEEVIEDNIKEIKGQSACRGNVKGRVRLILESSHIGGLKEGEILVTEMTTPEFVPAMKKAAAIVTDEGGITCHAAIVSRELNKPCVIGTKIASRVLKDGNQVEVDADNGVVKILNKT